MARTKETVGCLLRFIMILSALTACSPPVPQQPTATNEIGATASIPANTNTSPLATLGAAPEATAFESPLQPAITEAIESSPTTRIAIVDQSSAINTSHAGWWSISTLGPVGQTFRPSFAGLDAIELWTEDQWDEECSGAGARLQVNIHEATIDGPLVGSSSPIVLPDCFKGITSFGFPSLIALTPGGVYAIEVGVTSGDNWGVVWQQVPDAYLHGESIVQGTASDADIWFQAGLRNSTPLSEAYCQNDLWPHVKRADGSAFRNQGDCVQYVNTGQ
jgi:hypothetical protein